METMWERTSHSMCFQKCSIEGDRLKTFRIYFFTCRVRLRIEAAFSFARRRSEDEGSHGAAGFGGSRRPGCLILALPRSQPSQHRPHPNKPQTRR
jgi:hypothetical protein